MQSSMPKRVLTGCGAMSTAALLFVASAIPAAAETVTFVRHGESQGNASGLIDTKVPGPPLTGSSTDPVNADPATGWSQAKLIGVTLNDNGITYDGVYASTMIRTQQTATPYAADAFHGGDLSAVTISTDPYHPDTNKDVVVLNGLQEISAGIFEGSPQDSGIGRIGYIIAPLAWTLGLRFVRIPGSEDGNEFDARVDGALDQIAANNGDDPDANDLVFSHGATIMFWTMMNVDNPDLSLILTHPLDNTDVVVVESNGEGGWTLKSWAGQDVAPANLPTQLLVNTRDLIVAPQTAAYNLREPVLALDPEGIVTTGVQGVKDVTAATAKFVTDTVTDIGDAIRGAVPSTSTLDARTSSTDAADASDATDVDVTRKVNGATDLSAGNKVVPGTKLASALGADGTRVTAAIQGVKQLGDEVSASVQQVRATLKKAADDATKKVTAAVKSEVKKATDKDAA